MAPNSIVSPFARHQAKPSWSSTTSFLVVVTTQLQSADKQVLDITISGSLNIILNIFGQSIFFWQSVLEYLEAFLLR